MTDPARRWPAAGSAPHGVAFPVPPQPRDRRRVVRSATEPDRPPADQAAHHALVLPGGRSVFADIPRGSVPRGRASGPDRCPADLAIQVTHAGTRRAEAVRLAEQALSSEDCATDPRCYRHAVLSLVYAGDLASAEAHCAAALARPQWRVAVPVRQAFTLLRARIKQLTGNCVMALDTISGLLSGAVHPGLRGAAVAWVVEALVQLDELSRAEALLADHDLLDAVGVDVPDRAAVLAARGAVHLAAGRYQSAVTEYLECGRQLTRSHIVNPAVVPWRSRAALAALATRRVELALALADDELLAARRWGSPAAVGTALHPVALLRDDDRSVDLLTDAVDLLDIALARTEQIWTLHDLGLVLSKRRGAGAARARLYAARELAQRHGHAYWARRTRSALDTVAAPAGGAPLTRQEARIARLAAAGRSNKQIAAELCLTVRTVEFHLSGVYRKLGISGRRELGSVLAAIP